MPRKLLDDEDTLIRGGRREKEKEPLREPEDRPSWRDVDRRKDRSSHVDSKSASTPRGAKNRYLQERDRKQNLGVADALFANDARSKLEERIVQASSSDLDGVIDDYIQQFDYPDAFELLSRFAEHSSPVVVKTALKKLGPMLEAADNDQVRGLVQSLRLTSMMGRSSGARSAASSFLRKNKLTNV